MQCPQCQHENPPHLAALHVEVGDTTNVAAGFLQAANLGGGPRTSTADSPVSVWMIPTNEEMMIASHTLACIRP
jgi:acetate kinase